MKKIKIAAAVVLTLASAASFAQSKDAGFYGLGQFGTTKVDSTITSTNGGSGTSETQGNGWMFGLGYDFDKTFSVEGSYGQFYKSVNNDSYHNSNNTYINNKASTVNATGLMLTGLAKYPVSENVKLFAGPSLMVFRVKGNNSQYYKDGNGTYAPDPGSFSFSKNIPGLTFGASFALDQKTDLRVTYNKMKEVEFPTDPGQTEKDKLTTILFGLSIKF